MPSFIKRISLLTLGLLLCALAAQAQKFAYVDTKYILEKVPEYGAAEKELDMLSKKWQKELDDMYANIEKMYEKYRSEEVLLSDAVKKQRQDEILAEEKKAKEYQRKRFGYEGDLFKMRGEKVKPIQDRVFQAVEEVAKERRLNFVFDKAGAVTILYTDTVYDLSDLVLTKLGIQPQQK
jgi:outer membrane protein